MFNSMLRDFEEDPFFSDQFRAHREQMRQMMRSFSEPFGASSFPSITDGRNHGRDVGVHPSSSLALRNEHRGMHNHFGMLDNMMVNVRNRMEEMHRNFENMSTDSNSHSFSSSSVMTYSKVGSEPPKVFQAVSSTRRAPGGIKETHRAVKDSESGLQKMRIGHHIKDKGHIVEKKYNKKTGEKELSQDFQNMDESEAQSFDDEWQQELSRFQPSHPTSCLRQPPSRSGFQAALMGPEHSHGNQKKLEARDKDKTESSKKTSQ
ncbi:myeloid leukemia factor 1 isoform X3 [Nothobranchius furzeri]|uniref:Myeloid leukemia factor 1 n=1 Tax=Nothobranchius furzeri TaxID=105023 RepID=A0A8C6PAZ1_NOTFU|nr:myeloid leukemia factor 1 isoform X4 [Nothobranchius furzeri]KAF7218924.1 transcript variant X4 [Nothobranchius furzeri]